MRWVHFCLPTFALICLLVYLVLSVKHQIGKHCVSQFGNVGFSSEYSSMEYVRVSDGSFSSVLQLTRSVLNSVKGFGIMNFVDCDTGTGELCSSIS